MMGTRYGKRKRELLVESVGSNEEGGAEKREKESRDREDSMGRE